MKEESKKEKEGKEGAHLSHTPAYPECVDAEDRLWLVANCRIEVGAVGGEEGLSQPFHLSRMHLMTMRMRMRMCMGMRRRI